MNPLDLLNIIPKILRLKDIVLAHTATGLSFKNVVEAIEDPAIIDTFAEIGKGLFPAVAPELQAVAAIVSSYDANYVKWVQNSLNRLVVPVMDPPLDVDGHYGPLTKTATDALQTQLGLKPDSWVGDITASAIRILLIKLDAPSLVVPAPTIPTA